MLVLSRRSSERVLFPTLDIAVEVLQVKSNAVRIGIEAPPDVPVVRGELSDRTGGVPAAAGAEREKAHALCNRLSKVALALFLFERQWEAGRTEEARATLAGVLDNLSSMDREWVMKQLRGSHAAVPARCRTLVVEDDSNQRELLAGLLRMNGCECATAVDGVAALDYLASHERPDVLLVDMWMPNCDGPGTVRRVRSDPRYSGMKVFTISSTPPQEAGLSTGPDGVDAWFPKPLNPRKLWETIRDGVAAAGN
jgi:carbon storage regulator CsrA